MGSLSVDLVGRVVLESGGGDGKLPRSGEEGPRRRRALHGCQMVIARFKDCRVWPFGLEGLWLRYAPLRYAAKFDPFLSLDCAPSPPHWRNPRKGRDQILPSGDLDIRLRQR